MNSIFKCGFCGGSIAQFWTKQTGLIKLNGDPPLSTLSLLQKPRALQSAPLLSL
jgi:hypothetical protein